MDCLWSLAARAASFRVRRSNEQQPETQISQTPEPSAEYEDALSDRPTPSHVQPEGKPLDTISLPLPVAVTPAGKCHSTQECYHLQPTASHKKKKKGRRCEPQSLPFARCRSGISSCGLGWNNGPLTWFACEKQQTTPPLFPETTVSLSLAPTSATTCPRVMWPMLRK